MTNIQEKMKEVLHVNDFESLENLGNIMQYIMMKEAGMEEYLLHYYLEQHNLTEKDVEGYSI